jgi:hypothetical protein
MIERSIKRLKFIEAHPMHLPESVINDKKNLGIFERTASNLKNDASLEDAFTQFVTSSDVSGDQFPVEISFYEKTNLGKYVLDNFGGQTFYDLVEYFHNRRFGPSENESEMSIFDSWGDLIVAVNFSPNFIGEMSILKGVFSSSELLTEEYRTKLISFLTSLEKDISDNITLFFNSLGIANSAFLERFKNSLPDLKILITFFESVNLKNVMVIGFIKLLINALYKSLCDILQMLDLEVGESLNPGKQWTYEEIPYHHRPKNGSLNNSSCDFTNLDKIANDLDVSDLESLKNDSTWLNYLFLSVGNLCFQILCSKLFGAYIV